MKGEGNQQDYGMRIYDPRIGKFLSVDPITKDYPELTPYQFASNRPIDGVDQDGLEWELSTILHQLFERARLDNDVRNAPSRERERKFAEARLMARLTATSVAPTPQRYGPDQRAHEKKRVEMMNSIGRNADGSMQGWLKLARNKTFSKFADNIALPILEMGVGEGIGRLFSVGSKGMATLGEGIDVFDVVVNQKIAPGARGVFLGSKRLTEIEMRAMTEVHKVEFAQVYTMGSGKNGGGGYYTLYSGTANSVDLPISSREILINHTHPGGTLMPSSYDVKYLWRTAGEGSPQKSSSIIPNGGSTFRFNGNTPVSDPQNLKKP